MLNLLDRYRKQLPLGWGFFVRVKGLEPPRREALDPKSSVATNFTTPARLMVDKYNQVLLNYFS